MARRFKLTTLLAALGLALSTAAAAGAAAPAQWPATVIRARGWGRPPTGMAGPRARLMARRAAEVTAVHNLALKLRVPAGRPVRGFRYLPPVYRADGTVEVIVEYGRR